MFAMLTEKDVETIYKQFTSTPTKFDCGKKCAPKNGGIPVCCDADRAIPVVYRAELNYLLKRTDLWKKLNPKSEYEKKLVKETDPENVYVHCKGPAKCDRKYRSFTCRIFPLYPYLDLEGNTLGLVFNRAVGDDCYLLDKPGLISLKHVKDALSVWKTVFLKMPGEKELFIQKNV